ncbi:nitrate reductase [Indioceanicola profundi]|uniref:nitrate reductase n=1 Tax=Indioceanicola profundi TaxID=2220096 RepID=UPI000E6ABEF6|nr:nitrate reductase [Indioceanicola profundi]
MPDALQPPASVKTTCPYCGVGCGILATPGPDGGVRVEGDPGHPANFGRLCSKGSALGETVDLSGRLLHPMVKGKRTGWDQALELVADTFARTIAEHGPDSVAFYVSGQILTEDYYVANKLMKGFIGSANIDTNSRLCMASTVAGHRRAFGADVVPGCYEDLEQADTIVLVGSNLMWCHPVLFQRIQAAREARPGMKLVVVDPRRTQTAAAADLHLPLAPDSDTALFNGLLTHLHEAGLTDSAFVEAHTAGLDAALEAARLNLGRVAELTGLAAERIADFYRLWAGTEKVVTVFSQGVNQSGHGTDKVNAIINCHLLTGRISRPGMGPLSVTGQPNAMGGREVGGLANQLAAHLTLEEPTDRELVRQAWNAPRMADKAGLKAVDLFQGIADGRVKAVWIMGTNPVDSMPAADAVRAGLADCPFVVVSDVMAETDTTLHADVLLPAAGWGEKDGTVTNSERRISRQRAFLPLPGEARPDWWIITQVARRMGFADQFAYGSQADIFREYAALTALAAASRQRPLDIGAMAGLDDAGYAGLEPVQWPVRSSGAADATRLFADGRFATLDGRARFVPTCVVRPESLPVARPLVLNTGRIRDQWHTMTRTGKSPRLSQHLAEPFLEIHPDDAAAAGIVPAGIVRVESDHGEALLRALVTDTARRGSVFAPMHWTDRYSAKGRIDAVVAPRTDPVSGQPALKNTAVTVTPAPMAWYGFAVLNREPLELAADYWAKARTRKGWRVELAGVAVPADWLAFAERLFGDGQGEIVSYGDPATGRHRFALVGADGVEAVLFLAPEPVTVARTWVVDLMSQPGADIRQLLAGRPGKAGADRGAIVCACFDVGAKQIAQAAAEGCETVDAVGKRLRAGTNCGSCRTEIGRILTHAKPAHAQ